MSSQFTENSKPHVPSNKKVKWVLTDQALYDITGSGFIKIPFENIHGILIETAPGEGKRKSFGITFMGNKPHYHSTVKASDNYRINMIVEIVRESLKKGKPIEI